MKIPNGVLEFPEKLKRNSEYLKPPKFSFDVIFLFLNHLIRGFSIGMISLFLPIFLFEKFNHSVQNVLVFYIASVVVFGLLIPLGAKIMSSIGLKQSMILAMLFLAEYCLALYYFEGLGMLIFIAFAILTMALSKMLYWVPYNVDFAKFTSQKDRGSQIAYLSSFGFIVGVISPFFAGFIIAQLGFEVLFIVAMAILIIAIFPLFFISPVREHYSFSYFQTFREVFSRKNRKILIGYGSDGAQTMVSVVIWPIFIFGLLKENYMAVGGITAAIVFATVFLQLIMGSLTDRKEKRSLIKAGSALYALGWVIKIFVANTFQIFIVSAYHSFAGIIRGIPFSAFSYEEMAGKGSYIDEYTVLREISLYIGKLLMLMACFVLLYFVGLVWTFLLAAIASLFIRVL